MYIRTNRLSEKMKKPILFIAAMATLLIASCTKGEGENPQGQHDGRIRINSTIRGSSPEKLGTLSSAPSSRALAMDSEELPGINFVHATKTTELNPGEECYFSVNSITTGTRAAGAAGAITFATGREPFYSKGNALSISYMMGYYPAGLAQNESVTWASPDGATDILLSNLWNAGTFLAPNNTGLVFDHLLCRVEVKCVAKSGQDLAMQRATWGKVTSIKVKGTPEDLSFSLSNNKVTYSSELRDTPLLKGALYDAGQPLAPFDLQPTGGTDINAAGMVTPISGSTTITLLVTTEVEGTREVEVEVGAAGLSVAKTHTMELVFNAVDKNIIARPTLINDWQTGFTDDPSMVYEPVILTFGTPPFDQVDPNMNKTFMVSYNDLYGTSVNGFNGKTYNTSTYANEAPFYKFTVDSEDVYLGTTNNKNWHDLRGSVHKGDICQQNRGDKWRMPRASELRLMYLNREALEQVNGFKAFTNGDYVSTTETGNASFVLYHSMNRIGGPHDIAEQNKIITSFYVRCIKEVVSSFIFDKDDPTISTFLSTMDVDDTFFTTNSYNDLTGEGTATNGNYITSLLDPNTDNITEPAYNKFEVDGTDIYMSIDPSKDWRSLRNACDIKGDGWRMPRAVENQLMSLLLGSETFFLAMFPSANFIPLNYELEDGLMYWSSTEYDADTAWMYNGGDSQNIPKTSSANNNDGLLFRVRCIREL